jgi:hypothetical protein
LDLFVVENVLDLLFVAASAGFVQLVALIPFEDLGELDVKKSVEKTMGRRCEVSCRDPKQERHDLLFFWESYWI